MLATPAPRYFATHTISSTVQTTRRWEERIAYAYAVEALSRFLPPRPRNACVVAICCLGYRDSMYMLFTAEIPDFVQCKNNNE